MPEENDVAEESKPSSSDAVEKESATFFTQSYYVLCENKIIMYNVSGRNRRRHTNSPDRLCFSTFLMHVFDNLNSERSIII